MRHGINFSNSSEFRKRSAWATRHASRQNVRPFVTTERWFMDLCKKKLARQRSYSPIMHITNNKTEQTPKRCGFSRRNWK